MYENLENFNSEQERDGPMPCPQCGGRFPNPASMGVITCENGHSFTLPNRVFIGMHWPKIVPASAPTQEFDWDRDCVACDFTGATAEALNAHYERWCGPNGDDLHRAWV